MAAAYAALVSLSNILHQILNPHPTHHFQLPRESLKSLGEKVSSLIKFLETYPSRRIHEIEDLAERIVGAVHEAEDLIESYVVRKLLVKYPILSTLRSFDLYCRSSHMAILDLGTNQNLLRNRAIPKVIEGFISMLNDLDEIKRRGGVVEDAAPEISTASTSSASLTAGKNTMVGFEEQLKQMRSAIATDESGRLILPIVGMGGIGKTTLASNVYSDPFIVECFDIRAWVSVSQEYKDREIIILLLQQINSKIDGSELSVGELGVLLHKELFGKKYLVVLDDMWEIQAWDKLKRFLPDNSKKSRILVTTRNVDLARDVGSGIPHKMSLLDEHKSWDLILKYVKGNFPIELEEIGKSIARGCRGLPLACVVIGGLLAKSDKTRNFWMYVEENVTSAANHANDEQCLNILRLSYNQLPVHLKPCFLYLAVFPKNFEIRMSRLIRLWVAEGFIKPREGKTLEEVAECCVKDLMDRNLVMISKRGRSGKVKNCGIHDFIRDLCMAEAQKDKFLWIAKLDNPNHPLPTGSERCVSVHTSTANEKVDEALRLGKYNRSLLSYSAWQSKRHVGRKLELLRVLDVVDSYSMDEILMLFNSRYVTCAIPRKSHVSSCLSFLWNLQTVVFPQPISLPPEFWRMPQLRHLKIPRVTLANPPDAEVDDENLVVLENLQTLASVKDFIFSENVLRRIPNLKKLGIDCETTEGIGCFGLSNLALVLHKLESLVLKCRGIWETTAFPESLRKLTLSHCQIPWEDMTVVGSLPNLEVLKLLNRAAKGQKWSPKAGQFLGLKFLLIDWCQLEIWEADESHFPNLEHLHLVRVRMEEFPMDFSQIATLQTIDLNYCSRALFLSAKMMSGEREFYGYEDIQIRSFPSQASRSREKNVVVGLEDVAEKLKTHLSEKSRELDVISIVGQGGLGKTTLTRKIFDDPDILYEFPTRIWITVSKDFCERDVFLSILEQLVTKVDEDIHLKSTLDLANHVSEGLEGGSFLLVLDDVGTLGDWDKIRIIFPVHNTRGKVLLTSRQMDVCRYANPHRDPHELRFLTCEESWLLLQLEVFGSLEFPSELEVEGKLIADKCRGLPLAIVLVGGILVSNLSASDQVNTLRAALNVYSISSNADLDFHFVQHVMLLSYENLPRHLRMCFLYVGMFPTDYEIPTRKLIRMWISEGFIQEEDNICVEETAEKYLDNLISSNLLRVGKLNVEGKVKTCSIHDLVRDFCHRRATEETGIFFQELRSTDSVGFARRDSKESKCKRICIHSNVLNYLSRRPYGPSVSSFVCFSKENFVVPPEEASAIPAGFKLLRVLDAMPLKISKLPSNMYQLLHLRYLTLSIDSGVLPQYFSRFQNIQTIVLVTTSRTLDIDAGILNMVELRHFETNAIATLPKPDTSGVGGDNIQTLGTISPESCTEDVFDRVRNLKKLSIRGKLNLLLEGQKGSSFSSLQKLENLEKLKLLNDVFPMPPSEGKLPRLPPADTFPMKLRSLTLQDTLLEWEHMSILGSLENLEVLKLKYRACVGKVWEASIGGFPHLQVLVIDHIDLAIWEASHHHFPRLKRLEVRNCQKLLGVPVELADAPNFQHLDLNHCRSTAASARVIEARKRRGAHPFHLSIFPPDSY